MQRHTLPGLKPFSSEPCLSQKGVRRGQPERRVRHDGAEEKKGQNGAQVYAPQATEKKNRGNIGFSSRLRREVGGCRRKEEATDRQLEGGGEDRFGRVRILALEKKEETRCLCPKKVRLI